MSAQESVKKVALLITGLSHHARRAEPGIYRFARQRDDWSIVDFGFATFGDVLELVGAWQPDGVLIALESQQAGELNRLRHCYQRMQSLGSPIVNIACDSPRMLPSVMVDPDSIGQLAVDHLVDCGCVNVVYFGIEEHLGSNRRANGMRQVCEQRQVPFQQFDVSLPTIELLQGPSNIGDDLRTWVDGLAKPVGVCCHNELLGAYLCRLCIQLGYNVPADVAVLGPRDEPLCETAEPTLSGIDYSADELGFAAADLLDRLMQGGSVPQEPIVLAANEVIARQSTLEQMPPNIAEALSFIRENACRGIGVPDLLHLQPVSRVTFERHFKAVVGRSPGEEIRRVRAQTAGKLLRETDMPIAKIAERCGFGNSSKFSLFFKKAVGVNPSKYRQQRSLS